MIAKNIQEKHMNKERHQGRNEEASTAKESAGKTFRIRTPDVDGKRERTTGKVHSDLGELKHELKNV
jgi:uncharacterized protein YjbJ (UPF0337 family)